MPLMQALYDWIHVQVTVLSRHSDTAKAFAYQLKQWDALNVAPLRGEHGCFAASTVFKPQPHINASAA